MTKDSKGNARGCSTAQDEYQSYSSRERKQSSNENAINMWIVSDNLLKGAALNSVQIAETLVKYGIK